jgi:AcrR family transcriptional regulator
LPVKNRMSTSEITARPPASAPPAPGADGASRAGARASAQRARILAAATKCFVEHGFHAASMANIADAAQMSPGLMYRYFPSKSAIVLAIIERQLADSRARIGELRSSTEIMSNLRQSFAQWQSDVPGTMNAALFLAMSADARRDPRIASALRESDRLTRADLEAWLGRSGKDGGRGMRAEVAESRAILLLCVIEGLAVRALREPDLEFEELAPALRRLLDQLLTP